MKNLLWFTGALLLAACQQSSVSTAEADSAAQAQSDTATGMLVQEQKAAVEKTELAMAKMASSSLQFTHSTASERAQVGVPFQININFENFSTSSYTAKFVPTPGLQLTSAERTLINPSEKGFRNTQTVTVVPQAEGIYFLNIFQLGAVDQKPSAIKIVAGDKDIREYMQTVGEIVEAEDGSKVISMKADEG